MSDQPVVGSERPTVDPLAATFVDLARAATEGANSVELFTQLAERCTELLPIDACGVLVVDHRGLLEVVGSSDSAAHLLDLFQIQADQGPCLECCRTGELVRDDALEPEGPWPRFARAARDCGFTSVVAVPLRAQRVTLGALNAFCAGHLGAHQVEVLRALADAATVALLQADPELDSSVVTRRIVESVESRNAVEQAIGVLSVRFDCPASEALARLRAAAERHREPLVDVARAVVRRQDGSPAADELRA